ncbi:MAG: hypothetical protein BAJALOKI1v1_1140007 [Promethearchaeota archaeon]|nr:MAG: hypothetical protein BAJALOKI1v1_1140007 [Candidatus Lokiarchaeota archaeon]
MYRLNSTIYKFHNKKKNNNYIDENKTSLRSEIKNAILGVFI